MSRTPPLKRLRVGLTTLGALFLIAVVGYKLAGWTWLEAIYMVVVTLSTVGYRETGPMTPGLEAFTVLVIVFGVSTALYVLGGFFQMMTEGEIDRALGLRRVSRGIRQLSDHVIVCGFGRMGEILAGELQRAKRPLLVVDNDPERITEAIGQGYLALTWMPRTGGDATGKVVST